MSFEEVGKNFVQHYYAMFDSQRDQIATLYTKDSMLSFEGEQFLGVEQIMGKLGGMPSIKHKITTFDAQPTLNNGIIAFVSGDLVIDDGQPVKFAQTFHLAVGGSAGYYCHNDLFRLNYG